MVHPDAALALWKSCFESARFIFGASLGNPVADDIHAALVEAGPGSVTRGDMTRELFGRNRSRREIQQALAQLLENRRALRSRPFWCRPACGASDGGAHELNEPCGREEGYVVYVVRS